VIWPKIGYFNHFYQERLLLIQNQIQPTFQKKKTLEPKLEVGHTAVKAMTKSQFLMILRVFHLALRFSCIISLEVFPKKQKQQ
jgi:hypothetical protein